MSTATIPSAAPEGELEEQAARLRVAVARLARVLRQQAGTGLSPTQHSALVTIERSGPVSIGDLAEAEQVSAPTATRVVDRLEAAGLVRRTRCPEDRRVVRVALTPAGRRRLEASRSRRTLWLAHRLAELSAEDRRRLGEALDVLEALSSPEGGRP